MLCFGIVSGTGTLFVHGKNLSFVIRAAWVSWSSKPVSSTLSVTNYTLTTGASNSECADNGSEPQKYVAGSEEARRLDWAHHWGRQKQEEDA